MGKPVDAALKFAKAGWPVFPVEPGGKAPIGRLVPNGVKNATTDEQQIRDWWSVVPSANIGVATGPVFVTDLDVKGEADGLVAWKELIEGREMPETLTVRTPSGGRHYFFRAPAGVKIPNDNRGRFLGDGIDIKGHGGYVVAPLSSTDAGTYEFETKVPVADAPPWLIEKLTTASANGQAARGAEPAEGDIPKGQRNGTLTSLAGSMRRRGMSEAAMFAALMEENKARCRPPLPEDEVRRIAASVARYDPAAEETEEKETEKESPTFVPFPVDALPSPCAGYVRACEKALPCSPAMVAVPMLSVLASAVGAAAEIQLKSSWQEPSPLWTMLCQPSGSIKSSAVEKAVYPIFQLIQKAAKKYEKELQEYKKKKARGEDVEKPKRRRYRVDDITVESVCGVLSDNPRGVLSYRDELAGWFGMMDRYAKNEADMQSWISMYEGRPVAVDRKTTKSAMLSRPAVSVCGTIQPGTLRKRVTEQHIESGFLARLQIVSPPARPKRFTEHDVTPERKEAYADLVEELFKVEMGTTLGLTREAKELFAAFVNANGKRVFAMDEGPARSVAAKTDGLAARLALVLHLARRCSKETTSTDVDAESMARALTLAKWLRDETLRVYEVLELAEEALPPQQRFLRKLPDEFKTGEAEVLSEDLDVTDRTIRNWLSELVEQGDLEKIRRGLYRKTYPASSFHNFRNLHKESAGRGPSMKEAEVKENGNGESAAGIGHSVFRQRGR